MYTFKYLKEIFLKSLPIILLYFISFSSFEGLKAVPNAVLFSFNFHMIIIYFYILKYPDYLGIGHIFLTGLINDVVVGSPLGASSLSFYYEETLQNSFFTFLFFPIFYFIFKKHQMRFKED
jgi:cell shape-determining protein MreD